MNRKAFISILLISILLNACTAIGTGTPSPELTIATPATVHWTYEGEEGPSRWGELSPDYASCSGGLAQSPIDISNPETKGTANLVFHYLPSKINILNNGHTVQVNYDPGSYIELDNIRYDLTQFHFHAPSEHSINGQLFDAELHLVHKSADGKLAVVGILIKSGAENPAFTTTWENLPFTKTLVRPLSLEVDATALLPAGQEVYGYSGSLTTPPCTEGVKWNVMAAPIEMSATQLFVFSNVFEGNNRPVQPLNGRTFIQNTAVSTAAPAPVHWTYEGGEGPEHWGGLSPEYAACSSGQAQSPIDISSPASQDLTNLVFHYQPSKINILNNGHTVQVNYDPGSYIELDSVRYDLAQFHFHAPSEHSINGQLFDAEVHLVHKSADGKLAVVGILIKIGADNPAFTSTMQNLPSTKTPVQTLSAEVDAYGMLPVGQETFRYSGSLTTPPCTEGVAWNVMVEPIEMSEVQLNTFRQIFEGNNRPIQPLNGRTLLEDTTP